MAKRMKRKISRRMGVCQGIFFVLTGIGWMLNQTETRLVGINWITTDSLTLERLFYTIGAVWILFGAAIVWTSLMKVLWADWAAFIMSWSWPGLMVLLFTIAWVTGDAPRGYQSALWYAIIGYPLFIVQVTSVPVERIATRRPSGGHEA